MATTYTLPATNGFSGSISLPAPSVAASGTLSVTSSTAPCETAAPFGISRKPQSQTITVFYCATFTPSVDVTYPSVPSFTINVPPSVNTSGSSFYYAISVAPPSGALAQFRQEGPAAIVTSKNGCTLTYASFGADNQPLTLKAGVPTVFAFYSVTNMTTAEPTGTITEYAPKFALTTPINLTTGPDGNVWFYENLDLGQDPVYQMENYDSRIGRAASDGTIAEHSGLFSTGSKQQFVGGLAANPDGTLYYTGELQCYGCPTNGENSLKRITTSGVVSAAPVDPNASGQIAGPLTTGPDGAIYLSTLSSGGYPFGIRRETTTGTLTSINNNSSPPGLSSSGVFRGLTPGPDGNVWFKESSPSNGSTNPAYIAKITPMLDVTAFSAPGVTLAATVNPELNPGTTLAPGPDGNEWFTTATAVEKITPGGVISSYSVANPITIALGPDGNLWFTQKSPSRIGRITPAGVITEYATGLTGEPFGLAADGHGYMWFTEPASGKIGKIRT